MRGLIILILISALAPSIAFAQQSSSKDLSASNLYSMPESSSDGQSDNFKYIKSEISRLMRENKKFETKYQAMKDQLDRIRGVVEKKEQNLEKISSQEWEENRSREREIHLIKALYKDSEKLKEDLLLKKSRNAYLSGQLLDLEEKQRLWKLKFSDLDYLKREIELDIKMMDYELTRRNHSREKTINDLRKKIQDNLEGEREILSRISSIEEGDYYSPSKASNIEVENDVLEVRIQALENDLKFQKRESDILEKKKLLASKSRGYVPDNK